MKKMMVVMAVALLAGCGDDPPPQSIKEISTMIAGVDEDKDSVKIHLEARPALREKDHFQNVSMETARISEKLIRYFPQAPQSRLIYVVSIDVVDKYGKNSGEPALELEYKMDDLRQVNFDTLFHRDILELAAPVKYLSIAGTQVIRAWCIEDENKSVAQRFCAANI